VTHALVIDDDAQICTVIREWLEADGIDAVLAQSAADGFHAFNMFDFDVMLVDIFMPKIDGLEVIKTFRKWAPPIPIIVMSGLADRQSTHIAPDFVAMAIRLGASYGLHKPFQAEQLMIAVKTCLEKVPRADRRTRAGVS
jgi:two-component system response regulator (stage 0 sporulation protein F)